MNFLKRHLQEVPLCEVWPKLSVALLGQKLRIDRTALARYRTLEEGIHFREVILHHLAQAKEIFIYDRDLRKLAQSLPAFDAFICALTALLADQNQCVKMPKGFSAKSGWIQYPAL